MVPEKAAHANGRKVNHELTDEVAAEPTVVRIGESDEELIEADIQKIIELQLCEKNAIDP